MDIQNLAALLMEVAGDVPVALDAVKVLYEEKFGPSKDFTALLDTFMRQSANSLKLKDGIIHEVNYAKLSALDVALAETEEGPLEAYYMPKNNGPVEDISETLIALLEEPSTTTYPLSTLQPPFSTDVTYRMMGELLAMETAKPSLARMRARNVPKKPFYEVCANASHCRSLGSFLYPKGGKQNLPDQKNAHARIKASNIAPEIQECALHKIHYLPLYGNQTDASLGDCSYLDTCHKTKSCRYLHYYTLGPGRPQQVKEQVEKPDVYTIGECFSKRRVFDAQWICCDVRHLPLNILGKFAAIINDPAWDIHMSLPYGTCKDSELLALDIPSLQDEGVLFLWVTGRSIEIGRKALIKWGYKVSDEMVWVKLNQLKRTIVTGRTGHWLNHSKEHLLVGLKGNPSWLNRQIDGEVIISSTRETSRKPDEVYGIIERLVGPHARKLEIFGRDHNTRPGWFTIGNQLKGDRILEKDVERRYQEFKNKSIY